MSSPAFEAFLVRIYVDREARLRFLAAPEAEAARAGLPAADRAALARIDRVGLEMAARSFAHKRGAAHGSPPRRGHGIQVGAASPPADTPSMTTHDTTHETADALDGLLRGEISAAETYGQALSKFEGHPETPALTKLRGDHVEAANLLRRHVAARHEENSTSSGIWGAFAKVVEGAAMLLGHTSALQALREGEEHGLRAYEKLLMRDDLDLSARKLITTMLLPRQRAQLVEVDRIIAVHARAKKA